MISRLLPIAVAAFLTATACAPDRTPERDTTSAAASPGAATPGATPPAGRATSPAGRVTAPDSAASPADATPPGAVASADGCAATPITGNAVGPLRIGATVEQVHARCAIVRDRTAPGAEGMPSRRIAVVLGADTVEAEIVDGRVWRVPVTSPRLRTADGLGAGIPLARLIEQRDIRPAMGEGLYVLSPAHCGLSFQLHNPGGSLPPVTTTEQLRRLPAATVVSRVLVTGCAR